jgi:hypothetical protein
MLRRQFIPFVVIFLAAYLCGGSASRLHLLAVLFAKPFMTLAFATLVLFAVQGTPDICRSLLLGWIARDFARAPISRLLRRHLHGYIDLQLNIPKTPCLPKLFQRPPPALAH